MSFIKTAPVCSLRVETFFLSSFSSHFDSHDLTTHGDHTLYRKTKLVSQWASATNTKCMWFTLPSDGFVFLYLSLALSFFILSLSWSTFPFCAFLQFASRVHFTISSAAIAIAPLSSLSFCFLFPSPSTPSCSSSSTSYFVFFSFSVFGRTLHFSARLQPNKKEKATRGEWRVVGETVVGKTAAHELPCTASHWPMHMAALHSHQSDSIKTLCHGRARSPSS